MKIAVLTSSRADFTIYLPLLKAMRKDAAFDFEIIAFGTHLSPYHGMTKNDIIKEGFKINHEIETLVIGDSPLSISTSISLTIIRFADFWDKNKNNYDLVFCLGDRYEMFGAVVAGLPFNIRFAHIHGGEKTLGAIDNIFRHSISHASSIHFTSTEEYSKHLFQMLDDPLHVYNVGALSLDNLNNFKYYTKEEFYSKWEVDFNIPTVLTTFHPETAGEDKNLYYVQELIDSIKSAQQFNFLITMPNADTNGNVVRQMLLEELSDNANIKIIENLGTKGYFSALKYCVFLLGNTSSGIIEAASFGKYVIDLGNRQKGRIKGKNVINVPINSIDILKAIDEIPFKTKLGNENKYYSNGASQKILEKLKSIVQ